MQKFNVDELKRKRAEAGLSRRAVIVEMAKQDHPISEMQLYRYETGKSNPGAAILAALANVYDCAVDVFFCKVA